MSTANLPRKQDAARTTISNLAKAVSTDAARFGIDPALAAELQAAADAFNAAYWAGNPAVTRNRVDVLRKEIKFRAAERLYRRVYSMIKWNDAVSDVDKISVAVRPVNRNRVKRKVPGGIPWLGIRLGASGWHEVLFGHNDPMHHELYMGGKPENAMHLQLFVAIDDKPVHDRALARMCGCYTRNPATVMLDEKDRGKVATYFGRWVTRRGETGGYSAPVSMIIAA